ncbi:MAG: hypothetical protein RLZZ37_128 [Actinomycetota bacterium]|jgi:anthranilate phosphoribosyltransferase
MNNLISWQEILSQLNNKKDLTFTQAQSAMNAVMDAKATELEIKEFLLGLKNKGESAEEITAFVDVMIDHSRKLDINHDAVDTCGTGGDGFNTVNISTAAAIVVASCGIPVVKHGNRAASSKSGSADVLEALKIKIDLSPEQVKDNLKKVGICFCFAPVFHPAMKAVAPIRKELATSTVFNFLGPLSNPATPKAQVVGVSNLEKAPIIAQVLANRKTNAFVVRGLEGLDEISICGPTQIWQVKNNKVEDFIFDAEKNGVKKVEISQLQGGDALTNAELIEKALTPDTTSALQDAICINAAAAIVAYENQNLDFETAINLAFARAKGSVASGMSLNTLKNWQEFSKSIS